MKTTTVTANAYQLTRLGFVNCYLVREADGLSLIDTGLPGSANDILAAAREVGAPIRRIVLTHAHMDHVGSLRAIETPGHIPGHLSFLDERHGTLFAGDALIRKGGLSVSGFAPWFFPFPNFGTWDKPTALASAKKLLAYPIELFASGHGAIQPGGRSALAAAIAKATS